MCLPPLPAPPAAGELRCCCLVQGCVQASLCPGLERYTVWSSFPVGHPVVGLLPAAAGVLSASSNTLRMHTRGGVPLLRMR